MFRHFWARGCPLNIPALFLRFGRLILAAFKKTQLRVFAFTLPEAAFCSAAFKQTLRLFTTKVEANYQRHGLLAAAT